MFGPSGFCAIRVPLLVQSAIDSSSRAKPSAGDCGFSVDWTLYFWVHRAALSPLWIANSAGFRSDGGPVLDTELPESSDGRYVICDIVLEAGSSLAHPGQAAGKSSASTSF